MAEMRKLNVVCFGGGTGMPSLLGGLKHNPWLNITAVVNMFDTGGSSGKLRDRFGILPPGDILKCLLSLSMDSAAIRNVLLRRIENDRQPGHTGGNVLLMGLESVYGDYHDAIDALGQIISARGKVLPVTLQHSTLSARYEDGSVAKGETAVDEAIQQGKILTELFLDPTVDASPRAIAAIKEADVFCVGPGSFYTSVLSNFLPRGIRESIVASNAPIILAMNLLTEGAGMKRYNIKKIIDEAERYLGREVSVAVVNKNLPSDAATAAYAQEEKFPILANGAEKSAPEKITTGDFWVDPVIARHDSDALAAAIWGEIVKRTSHN